LREKSGAWIVLALLIPIGALGASYAAPQFIVVAAQPFAVVVTYALFGSALTLWVFFRPDQAWPVPFKIFISSLAVLWIAGVARSLAQNDPFSLTALVVGPGLACVALKRSSARFVWMAGDTFALGLVSVSALAQVQDLLGVREMREQFWIRLPFIADFVGPIPRWEGPFTSPNIAGPVGAFLVVYGLWRSGLLRLTLIASGGVIVLLADSRTGFVAVLLPLVVLLVWRLLRKPHSSKSWRMGVLGSAVALAIVFLWGGLRVDPTVGGRVEIWIRFLDLWRENWLFGAGRAGIGEVISSGSLPSWADHGHSLPIDVLGRFGLLGIAALLVALVCASLLVGKDARAGNGAALSLLVMFVAAGTTEDLVDWRYLGIHYVPLLLSAMLAAANSSQREVES